jgi:hypothetical protein
MVFMTVQYRTGITGLFPFVVSLSNHERNLAQPELSFTPFGYAQDRLRHAQGERRQDQIKSEERAQPDCAGRDKGSKTQCPAARRREQEAQHGQQATGEREEQGLSEDSGHNRGQSQKARQSTISRCFKRTGFRLYIFLFLRCLDVQIHDRPPRLLE